jgi:hypothetical protein
MKFVADAVAVNPDDVLNQIVVYPNPFVENVMITNSSLAPLNIKVYDAAGKLLKYITSTLTNIDINMQKYPAGKYFIKIENKLNNKSISKGVIKQ